MLQAAGEAFVPLADTLVDDDVIELLELDRQEGLSWECYRTGSLLAHDVLTRRREPDESIAARWPDTPGETGRR